MWPFLWIILIYVFVPYLLKTKKFVERDNLKWIVWLGSFPVFGVILFIVFFIGEKAYCYINLPNIFSWLGITLLFWLMMLPIVFLGRSFGKHAPPWEVSPGEASDNAGELFDMAMKVGREKREGKDTSKQEAEYEQKLKNLEEISNSNKSNW